MPTPNPILITADLYRCRDTMRDLFGDQFQIVIEDYQTHLKKLAEHSGIAIIDAALDTAKQLQKGGHEKAIPLLLAAAVELIEPTQA